MDLKPAIKNVVDSLYKDRAALPRRQPGHVDLAGRPFRYVDQHSLFYQFLQIFVRDTYGVRDLGPSPYIIDAGAHIGVASLYFSQAHPQARIDAFEADPAIAEVLEANMATFAPSVRVVPAAVWVDDAGIPFAASQDDSGHVASDDTALRVPSVRLRSLIEAVDQVDLLKLDVEGAEFALFNDCRQVLDRVDRIIVEVHQLTANGPGLAGLVATLEAAGFRIAVKDAEIATWVDGGKTPFMACPVDRYILTIYAWR